MVVCGERRCVVVWYGVVVCGVERWKDVVWCEELE